MDDKEFKEKLSEVAEWKIPENMFELEKATPRSRRKAKVIEYDECESNDSEDTDTIEEPSEETSAAPSQLPIQLVGIKVRATVCEDCGRRCSSGRETQAKVFQSKTHKAWRIHCLTCGLYQNPYTGEIDLKKEDYVNVWTDWGRGVVNSQFAGNNQKNKKKAK